MHRESRRTAFDRGGGIRDAGGIPIPGGRWRDRTKAKVQVGALAGVRVLPLPLSLFSSPEHLHFLDGLAHGETDDKTAPLIDFAFCGERPAVLADNAPAK